jgi:abhydrolase domain-containing protein 12
MIAHAEDDWDIPWTHSQVLFDAFASRYLPPAEAVPIQSLPGLSLEDWDRLRQQEQKRTDKRNEFVQREEIGGFGSIEYFTKEERRVLFVKSDKGGHDYLGVQEGVQEYIRKWIVDA